MTRKCLLCGKLTAAVSYHVFPKDVTLLAKWKEFCLSANIEEALLSNTNYLCSSHFLAEDYLHPVGRVRNNLRRDAVPSVLCSTNVMGNYTQIEEAPGDNCFSRHLKIEDIRELEDVKSECSSTRSTAEPDTPIDEINNIAIKNGDDIPPSTPPSHGYSTIDGDVPSPNVSAYFDFEDNTIIGKNTSAEPGGQNPFFKEARYVGDIRTLHLATPHRAKRAIALAKLTIARQKSKILNLQQTTRRLKKRITTLKGLVQHLKQKNLKTEDAADDSMRNYRRMAKKFALIKWCGGDDDKTYTPGIPIEWIRGFDYTEYQKETFDVTEVFAIEWRDTKKPPKGGWKLYDAYIIAVSDDCKVLTRRMRLLDGSISPIKNASILKPDQGNIDENNSNKPKKKAITSLKLSSLPLAKKLKTVDSKAVTNITGSSKQSKPSRPDPKSNSVHNVSGVQESGARRYILSDSEDDNITELPSGSNASAVTMEDENSSAKSDVSEGTKTDAEDTVAGKSSADSHDSQKLVTKSTKENQQPEGTSFNNKPVSLEDLMNKLVTMDEKIEDILQNLGGKKGKATVRPSAVTSGIINTKFLENSAFIEGNIEIGDPGSGVTVTDLQWSSAISKTSYTAMAISLLMSLFPLDVLHRSNYKGGASKVGKHVDENVGRNYAALDERIIGAMKHAVLSKFPDKYNESGFGQAINGKLSSLRSKLHKK